MQKNMLENSMLKVRRGTIDETYPLRSRVLRDGKAYEYCQFPEDSMEETFHVVIEDEKGAIHGIATICKKDFQEQKLGGYCLRGMAVSPEMHGQGLGKLVIDFALTELKKTSAQYLWCNARKNAYGFYQRQGFQFISEEFDIEGIGPHKSMIINLS